MGLVYLGYIQSHKLTLFEKEKRNKLHFFNSKCHDHYSFLTHLFAYIRIHGSIVGDGLYIKSRKT